MKRVRMFGGLCLLAIVAATFAQTVEETTDFMRRALSECGIWGLPHDVRTALGYSQGRFTSYDSKLDRTTIVGNNLHLRKDPERRYNTLSADIPLNGVDLEFPHPNTDIFRFRCGSTKCIRVNVHPGETLNQTGRIWAEGSYMVSDLEVRCYVDGFGPRIGKAHTHYLKLVPAKKKDPF